MSEDMRRQLEEIQDEVRQLRRDLYGNPQIRQQGVFDRLEGLEQRLTDLRNQYEKERTEQGLLKRINDEVAQLKLDYQVMLIYLKGIGSAVVAIFVAVVAAIVVGILRFWAA